jgi:hypothetical protein
MVPLWARKYTVNKPSIHTSDEQYLKAEDHVRSDLCYIPRKSISLHEAGEFHITY